jgi:hypothetical protein
MDAKRNVITKLLESFPLTGGNYAVLIASFEERLTTHSTEAISLAVDRYRDGDVPGQQKRFAPSVAEFVEEVRRCSEMLAVRNRPRLPVLFENVDFDKWRKLSSQKQIPVGAKWVACLGAVYGPPAKSQSQAA